MYDQLLTATEVKTYYRFTDGMMKHLPIAETYYRIGQRYPIKLYRESDVIAFLESPFGKQRMAEAEKRRKRFWTGVNRRLQDNGENGINNNN